MCSSVKYRNVILLKLVFIQSCVCFIILYFVAIFFMTNFMLFIRRSLYKFRIITYDGYEQIEKAQNSRFYTLLNNFIYESKPNVDPLLAKIKNESY